MGGFDCCGLVVPPGEDRLEFFHPFGFGKLYLVVVRHPFGEEVS